MLGALDAAAGARRSLAIHCVNIKKSEIIQLNLKLSALWLCGGGVVGNHNPFFGKHKTQLMQMQTADFKVR